VGMTKGEIRMMMDRLLRCARNDSNTGALRGNEMTKAIYKHRDCFAALAMTAAIGHCEEWCFEARRSNLPAYRWTASPPKAGRE